MKERMLTVLVPILGDEDYIRHSVTIPQEEELPSIVNYVYPLNAVYTRGASTWYRVTATGYLQYSDEDYPSVEEWLKSTMLSDAINENLVVEYTGRYYRRRGNEVNIIIDVEFPSIGKPLEIFDFTYDATRMGKAPVITAPSVMWYADKDENGDDVTLEDKWRQDCHVIFNGESLYLSRIPTSGKSNEDARYKYDIDFVSEVVALENVYMYDVVSPYVSERGITESSKFSFFGDIGEFVKRVNVSLVRSGLANFKLLNDAEENGYFTFEEFNSIGLGTYSGTKDTSDPYPIVHDSTGQSIIHEKHRNIYEHFNGNYALYLLNCVYDVENAVTIHIGPEDSGYDEIRSGYPKISGYQCVIGNDKKGQLITTDEKMVSMDNNTIHEALQHVHDTYGLQYYIRKEKDESGVFTGNTLIMIADSEYDFSDMIGPDGEPTSSSPFNYGVDDALLSKEKTNTTEKIITRITGVGSEENIPWYYPNPTADGWLRPVFRRGGDEISGVSVDYPKTDGDTEPEQVRYEKYLKNRIGDVFRYRRFEKSLIQGNYDKRYVDIFNENFDDTASVVYDCYVIDLRTIEQPRVTIRLNTARYSNCQRFTCSLYEAPSNPIDGYTYDSDQTYTNPTSFQNVMTSRNGEGYFPLAGGSLYYLYITFYLSVVPNTRRYDYSGHYYPSAIRGQGSDYHFTAYIRDNFYSEEDLVVVARWTYGYVDEDYTGYGLSEDGPALTPLSRIKGCKFRDIASGDIYMCEYSEQGSIQSTQYQEAYTAGIKMDYREWIDTCIDLKIDIYESNGWYLNNNREKKNLADYGMAIDYSGAPDFYDTIEFSRIKYLTPQPTLMPQLYIKTDGERRYYVAHNYDPVRGEPSDVDEMVGEEYVNRTSQSGITQMGIINTLYSEDGEGLRHYDFENEYIVGLPKEHIEEFDDVKPTIKGQENTIIIDGQEQTFRIDVVEEFAYDEFDNNEVWESNEEGNLQGEYKHPYFFAKLRPLGFNIFDLALQDDMVLSMTTGHCGACNFKIGVDENTKKNPVQLWPYDVYSGNSWTLKSLLYRAGSLRRYIDESIHYYDTDGTPDGYMSIREKEIDSIGTGFIATEVNVTGVQFIRRTYSAEMVKNGMVGSLKQDGKTHTDGDVVTSGKFIESQQDTSENYVWVALYKDTDTYGVLMPSARPDYGDNNYSVYIRPKSVSDTGDEDTADNFVLTNIRLPQVYLRRAEKELSRRIIAYMYDNNYQKFNFSIKFSRIFIAQNEEVDDKLNENTVLYVLFNKKIYRQYVKHYTYRMSKGEPLPEISVDMNEELSVSRTQIESERVTRANESLRERVRFADEIGRLRSNIGRRYIGKTEDAVVSGNIVSRDAVTSFMELRANGDATRIRAEDTYVDVRVNHYRKSDFVVANDSVSIGDDITVPTKEKFVQFVTSVNIFNDGVDERLKQMRTTVEMRLLNKADGGVQDEDCTSGQHLVWKNDLNPNIKYNFWLDSEGGTQVIPSGVCAPTYGMTDITWVDFDAD